VIWCVFATYGMARFNEMYQKQKELLDLAMAGWKDALEKLNTIGTIVREREALKKKMVIPQGTWIKKINKFHD
jgi:hypothetical protein